MKKIYKRPELIVVECRTMHLMIPSKDNSTPADPNGEVLSRKIEWDTWDDD